VALEDAPLRATGCRFLQGGRLTGARGESPCSLGVPLSVRRRDAFVKEAALVAQEARDESLVGIAARGDLRVRAQRGRRPHLGKRFEDC